MDNFHQDEMFTKTLWLNPEFPYVFRKNIVEYDMQAASLSVSRRFHLLDDGLLDTLERMPKEKRTKEVGLIQRDDKEFSRKMIEGVLQTRKEFLQQNHLDALNVITLHNDAIIFIQTQQIIDHVENVRFVQKNTWSSYLRYENVEMFYENGVITYKNIPKAMLQQHTMGICQHLLTFFSKLEDYDRDIFRYLSQFQKKYLQERLPEYYYIPFGTTGTYKATNNRLLAYLARIAVQEMR